MRPANHPSHPNPFLRVPEAKLEIDRERSDNPAIGPQTVSTRTPSTMASTSVAFFRSTMEILPPNRTHPQDGLRRRGHNFYPTSYPQKATQIVPRQKIVRRTPRYRKPLSITPARLVSDQRLGLGPFLRIATSPNHPPSFTTHFTLLHRSTAIHPNHPSLKTLSHGVGLRTPFPRGLGFPIRSRLSRRHPKPNLAQCRSSSRWSQIDDSRLAS